MKTIDIVDALLQKVVDTFYGEWKHDGSIQVEHSEDFFFTLDGRLYKVAVRDVDCERPLKKEETK